jgi:uncharacterized protein
MAGKFEIKKSSNGKFHFNLKAGNGQIILSSELYESKSACENGIESIKKNAGNADRFDRRKTEKGDPYFVIKAGNGQEIGRSETYQGGDAAMENGIKSVMSNAPDATIVDTTAG